MRSGLLTALLPSLVLVVAGCSGTDTPAADPAPSEESSQDSTSPSPSTPAPEPEATKTPEQEPAPAVSVPGLAEQRHRTFRGEQARAEQPPQVAALDQHHVQVELPVDLPEVVHRHRMRVHESGREPRLPPEPGPDRSSTPASGNRFIATVRRCSVS